MNTMRQHIKRARDALLPGVFLLAILSTACTFKKLKVLKEENQKFSNDILQDSKSGQKKSEGDVDSTLKIPFKSKGSFAVVGDSYSIGIMSSTYLDRQHPAVFDDYFAISEYLKALMTDQDPLRASPEASFVSRFKRFGYNPFTSTGMDSFLVLKKNDPGLVQNLGLIGASLSRYEETIQAQINQINSTHELIFVQIGTQGFCSENFNSSDFQTKYFKLISDVMKKVPKLKKMVLIPPFPVFRLADLSDRKIFDYEEISRLETFMSEVAFKGEKKNISCSQIHKIQCPRLVSDTRENNWKVWKQMNGDIAEAISRVSKSEGSPELIFLPEIFNGLDLGADQMSLDCMHPGKKINEKIAHVLFGKLSE